MKSGLFVVVSLFLLSAVYSDDELVEEEGALDVPHTEATTGLAGANSDATIDRYLTFTHKNRKWMKVKTM